MADIDIHENCRQHSKMVTRMDNVEKDVGGLRRTLYGEDGLGGLLGRIDTIINKVVTKQSLWIFIGAVLGIVVAAFISVNTMWADSREMVKVVPKIENKIETLSKSDAKQDTEISVLQAEKLQLQKDVAEIKETVNQILRILQSQQRGAPEGLQK